jgi:hypothetical protein
MSPWSPQRIADRMQIEELLYLYCRAIDRIDTGLLATLFHADAMIDKGDGVISVAGFAANVARRHPGVPRASHMVTNHLIEFTGADAAFVESWCLAIEQHPGASDGDPSVDRIYRVRYGDLCERREKQWAIARRTFVIDHVMSVMVDPTLAPDMAGRIQGRRDRDDAIERLRRGEPS